MADFLETITEGYGVGRGVLDGSEPPRGAR
jgi:hypothetical protein